MRALFLSRRLLVVNFEQAKQIMASERASAARVAGLWGCSALNNDVMTVGGNRHKQTTE
jgi:hypothetical protein